MFLQLSSEARTGEISDRQVPTILSTRSSQVQIPPTTSTCQHYCMGWRYVLQHIYTRSQCCIQSKSIFMLNRNGSAGLYTCTCTCSKTGMTPCNNNAMCNPMLIREGLRMVLLCMPIFCVYLVLNFWHCHSKYFYCTGMQLHQCVTCLLCRPEHIIPQIILFRISQYFPPLFPQYFPPLFSILFSIYSPARPACYAGTDAYCHNVCIQKNRIQPLNVLLPHTIST